MRYLGILFVVAALFAILATSAGAATTPAPTPTLASTFCGGTTGTSSGVIPTNTILSGKTAAENNIIVYSFLIMIVMFMVTALIYMVSSVMNLPTLQNLAKEEIGEVFVTALIIIILIGGFNAAATSITGFNAAGTGSVRQIYVDDCSYMTQTSVSLIAPILSLNVIDLFSETVQSATIVVEPMWFGVTFTPLSGFALFNSVFTVLSEASFALVGMVFAMLFFLAFVYGLFPLFLYIGIILRTIPWTRPAGGAFLGLFIGFYIVFPLMLHFMLASYVSCLTNTACTSTTPVTANIGSLQTLITSANSQGGSNGSGFFTYLLNFIKSVALGNGLVPAYIQTVLEPAGFTLLAVIISFVIAFDFAELVGDLLGAPSLTGGAILNKLL